jgi:FixJ family two-component response regulator
MLTKSESIDVADVDDDDAVRKALARLRRSMGNASMGHAIQLFPSTEKLEAQVTAVAIADAMAVEPHASGSHA